MPESEPKPKPVEAAVAGSGQGWKAVLKGGKQAVVHEIPVAPAAAAAAVPRIQRLAEHAHPSLAPILAWGTDASGIWIAVEPNEGTPLSAVLPKGRFSPHAAARLGTSLLSGIAALHEAGVAMGGFDASMVRITGNGDVRLAGHPVAAVRGAPSQSDLRADVRSCGMAICATFGVDPAGAPAPPELPPGLVVTMRSMASGAMGPAVDRAQGALREMAGGLLAPDRQVSAQSELALRAGGREMPSAAAFIPQPEVPKPVPVEETPLPRPASYDPPARSVETYTAPPPAVPAPSPAPPPAASPPYRSTPPTPAPPPAVPTPTPVPPPAAPAFESAPPSIWATPPPQPAPPATPAFQSSPPMPPSPLPASAAATPIEAAPAPQAEPQGPPTAPPEPPAPAKRYEFKPAAQSWKPLETAEWTPGPAPIKSSDWTGETTPVPEEVPAELETKRSTQAPKTLTTPPIARASTPTAPPRAARRRPIDDMPAERPRWLVPAAAAVVVLLLLGIAAFYLANRGGQGTSQATASPHPTASAKSPSPSPTNVLQEVPVYAPSAAAPIASSHFCTAATPCVAPGLPAATDTNCTLGGACTIDVGIFYAPTYGGPVSYILKFFDRCTGVETDLPGQSGRAGNATFPKFSVSELSVAVALPAGARAAGLVAVTQTPSVVATPPLLLGANSC